MPTSKKIKKEGTRTGFGFDSHLFAKTGTLVLGAVKFPGTPRLVGHSDGDALLHAVVDALLGAAALGDIGEFFPDVNPVFKNMASSVMIKHVRFVIEEEAGWKPAHVDVTVLADRPKLGPAKEKIKAALSKLLQMDPSDINIKAKTQEGLTLFKKPGGIAVWAVATVVPA